MLSQYEVIEYIKKHSPNNELGIVYDEDTRDFVITTTDSKDTFHSPVSVFTNHLRRKLHCDFDVIYEDVLDSVVYRCNECGAVIITDNAEGYDPMLSCPCCGDYPKNRVKWYSKEQQKNDPNIKEIVQAYIDMQTEQDKLWLWEQKRNRKRTNKGKPELGPSELWYKYFYNKDKTKGFKITLKVNHLYYEKYKGLHIEIQWMSKDSPNNFAFTVKKWTHIPLSPHAVWSFWIFPHTKAYKELMKRH